MNTEIPLTWTFSSIFIQSHTSTIALYMLSMPNFSLTTSTSRLPRFRNDKIKIIFFELKIYCLHKILDIQWMETTNIHLYMCGIDM